MVEFESRRWDKHISEFVFPGFGGRREPTHPCTRTAHSVRRGTLAPGDIARVQQAYHTRTKVHAHTHTRTHASSSSSSSGKASFPDRQKGSVDEVSCLATSSCQLPKMALSWAQSKVERFQESTTGSSTLGPGDYDPCVPKSQSMAGAASLGFTSSKGLAPAEQREDPIPEETEAVLTAARQRTAVAAARRSSFGGPRPALNVGMSRLEKVKAEQQAKQLAWAETERGKLQEEVKTLRSLQVRVWVCGGLPCP